MDGAGGGGGEDCPAAEEGVETGSVIARKYGELQSGLLRGNIGQGFVNARSNLKGGKLEMERAN